MEIKAIGKKFFYIIKRLVYKILICFNTQKVLSSVYFSIGYQAVKQVVINLIFFIIIFQLDKLITEITSYSIILNSTLISDVLIAMIGVSGVFLGLYCSYTISIFSSKYADAPKRLSDLFKDDFLTNKSIKSITNYIIFTLLIIIFNLCNKDIGFFPILLDLMLGIYMIVSYINIGKRIFNLSDTYFIVDRVYKKITQELKRISKSKIYYKDSFFQLRIRNITYEAIDLLKLVNDYNIQLDDNKNQSMLEFMIRNLILIKKYLATTFQ